MIETFITPVTTSNGYIGTVTMSFFGKKPKKSYLAIQLNKVDNLDPTYFFETHEKLSVKYSPEKEFHMMVSSFQRLPQGVFTFSPEDIVEIGTIKPDTQVQTIQYDNKGFFRRKRFRNRGGLINPKPTSDRNIGDELDAIKKMADLTIQVDNPEDLSMILDTLQRNSDPREALKELRTKVRGGTGKLIKKIDEKPVTKDSLSKESLEIDYQALKPELFSMFEKYTLEQIEEIISKTTRDKLNEKYSVEIMDEFIGELNKRKQDVTN